MSRQYNMYNVQLSEFWKQRCDKETMHNAPYLFDGDSEDVTSTAPSRAPSQLSTTSTATREKVRTPRPSPTPPKTLPSHLARPRPRRLRPALVSRPPRFQIEELTKKLEQERRKREEVEQMLASFQDASRK
jgi:hypothetical protein